MIFIYELICKQQSHEVCNAGFLKLYSTAYPKEKIFFFADSSHIHSVKNELKNEIDSGGIQNINFKKISFSNGNSLIDLLKKYFFLKKEKKKWANNETIFLSFDLITLKILEFILKKNDENYLKILLVAHGILESISKNQPHSRDNFINPNSLFQRLILKITQPKLLIKLINQKFKNIFVKFTSVLVKIFFKNFDEIFWSFKFSYVKFVFLSEHIDLEIKKINKFREVNRVVIPMPVIIKNFPVNLPINYINFGIVGYGFPENQLKLFSLLDELKISKKFNLRLIGMQPDVFKDFKNINVLKPKNKIYLSRLEMEKAIRDIHFQIILYPKNSYKFSQSLSVFEAIRYQKPILHIKNPCVSYYNNKNLPIGIECNDVNQMSKKIQYLVENLETTQNLYQSFIKNISVLRKRYSNKNLIKKLHNINW